jgi:hypothetical protein
LFQDKASQGQDHIIKVEVKVRVNWPVACASRLLHARCVLLVVGAAARAMFRRAKT